MVNRWPISNRTSVWLVLAVALLLRLGLLWAGWSDESRFFTPDSHDYDSLARNLLEHGRFARVADGPAEVFRTPGYPLFLSCVYALTGGSVRAAITAQIVLDGLTCGLVYLIGRRLLSPRAALAVAGVYALLPIAIVASARLWSETLSTFLLALSLHVLTAHVQTKRYAFVFPAAVLLALNCLVRPIMLAPAAVMGLVLLARRRGWPAGVAVLLAIAACWWSWSSRNGFAGVSDYNLMAYQAKAVLDAGPSIQPTERQRDLLMVISSIQHGQNPDADRILNDPAFLDSCRAEGGAIIRAHPWRYLCAHARSVPNVFMPPSSDVLEVMGLTTGGRGTLEVLRREGTWSAVKHYFGDRPGTMAAAVPVALLTLAAYVLAAVGLVKWWRQGGGRMGWCLAAVFLALVLIPGPAGMARFLAPAGPIIALAAGASWLRNEPASPGPPASPHTGNRCRS